MRSRYYLRNADALRSVHRTIQALRYLSSAGQKGKRKGFFLMIEGSRIDMAG